MSQPRLRAHADVAHRLAPYQARRDFTKTAEPRTGPRAQGEGATTVAAYSARARAGLGVSMPLDWDDPPELKSAAQRHAANARAYLSLRKADPWADYARQCQTLGAAIKTLGFAPPRRAGARR